MNRPLRAYCVTLLVAILLAVHVGCSRSPAPEFSLPAEFSEMSQLHQQSIRDGMFRLFGNAVHPVVRGPAPDAEEPEEGEEWVLVDLVDPDHLLHGAEVFNARCAGCHGVTGDGAGVSGPYLRPKARDYRRGIFKFTSTPYGMKPTRNDLERTIRRGAKGTSMPAFPWMSDEDLEAVIDYVIYLSKRGEVEASVTSIAEEYDPEEPIEFFEFIDGLVTVNQQWEEASGAAVYPLTPEPPYSEETVVSGRTLFLSKGCSKCHGDDGTGQTEWLNPEFIAQQEALPEGQRIAINYDAWGEPAPAADLTSRILHGGRRPIDIYRRIYTGINGTPMPAFENTFSDEPEKIWHLVHYIRHIIEGNDPTAGIPSLPPEATTETETESETEDSVEAAVADDSTDATDATVVDDVDDEESSTDEAISEPTTDDEAIDSDVAEDSGEADGTPEVEAAGELDDDGADNPEDGSPESDESPDEVPSDSEQD